MPRKPAKLKITRGSPNFVSLVEAVRPVHEQSAAAAGRAVNVSLTMRIWLIGWHICEYEQRSADRAEYGERLLDRLAETLRKEGTADMSSRSLRLYRQFYVVYPEIWQSAIAKSGRDISSLIMQSLIAKFRAANRQIRGDTDSQKQRRPPVLLEEKRKEMASPEYGRDALCSARMI